MKDKKKKVIGSEYYYFHQRGAMATDWILSDENRYYLYIKDELKFIIYKTGDVLASPYDIITVKYKERGKRNEKKKY